MNYKIGDKVTRNLAGLSMPLIVTEIDKKFIHCGPWKFDKTTGAEIDEELDEELDWDNTGTGSYLEMPRI